MREPAELPPPAFAGKTLRVEIHNQGVRHLVLARPEVRNALDGTMISELSEALGALEQLAPGDLRLLVVRGDGDVFCAGADAKHMKSQASREPEANRADAVRLAGVYRRLAGLESPTLCLLRGAAMGGGLGLVACCDLVVAEETAVVGLPEVRLGLIPAVIGPYLVRRLGVAHALALTLSGHRVRMDEAQRIGLVQRVAQEEDFPTVVLETIHRVLRGGPEAVRRAKRLFLSLVPLPSVDVAELTAEALAEVRASAEARVGLEAFLGRRTPPWVPHGGTEGHGGP